MHKSFEKEVDPTLARDTERFLIPANISGSIRWQAGSLLVEPTVEQVTPLFSIHATVPGPSVPNAFVQAVDVATGHIASVALDNGEVVANYRIVTKERGTLTVAVEPTDALQSAKVVPPSLVAGGSDLVFPIGDPTVTLTAEQPAVDGVDFRVAYSPPPR